MCRDALSFMWGMVMDAHNFARNRQGGIIKGERVIRRGACPVLRFELACAGFLVSAVMLFEISHALKDTRGIFNLTKAHYRKMQKLERYRRNCIVIFVVFLTFAIVGIVIEIL